MFSSSSCDSENSDDEPKIRVTTLSRKRSYSISKGCTTITRETFLPFSCVGERDKGIDQSISLQSLEKRTVEATASKEKIAVNALKRPNSKRFTRSHNEPCQKPESSDSEAASSNANSTDDSTDNDTDTENHCGIVLNYIKPLLDSDASCGDAVETVSVGWHTDRANDTKVNSCSIDCLLSDGDKIVLKNEPSASYVENSDRNGVDGNCETILNCADFTELSHEHIADVQQQQQQYQPQEQHQLELAELTRTSFELDDNSISRANEQFGPHSQSSSNENKLSIDFVVDAKNDCESISDKVEAEVGGVHLQSNAVDDKTEACDKYVCEPHTNGQCESGENLPTKFDFDEKSDSCQDFVIITIDTEEDDDSDHVECYNNSNNNNNTQNNHQNNPGMPTKTPSSQRQNLFV